jgi:hypothetical protein
VTFHPTINIKSLHFVRLSWQQEYPINKENNFQNTTIGQNII